jgi:hypothetical protein
MSWGREPGASILDEAQKEPVVFDKVKFGFDEGEIDFTVLVPAWKLILFCKHRIALPDFTHSTKIERMRENEKLP